MYTRRIIKLGRSFGMTLPPSILAAMTLRKGDVVKVWLASEGRLVIEKIQPSTKNLEEVKDGEQS